MTAALHTALTELVAALRADVQALESGDLAALEPSIAAKQTAIATLHSAPHDARSPEIEALLREGAQLCDTAALRINLLLATIERRLNALTQLTGHGDQTHYDATGRMRAVYRSIDRTTV